MATQQEVIKAFMKALDTQTLDLFGNIKICYNSIGDKNENDRASG